MATYAFTVEEPITRCAVCPLYDALVEHADSGKRYRFYCVLTDEDIDSRAALKIRPYECPLHELSWDDIQAVALSKART